MGEAIMPENYLTLRKILKIKDPAMLYRFNPFWAPFFCPTCQEAFPSEEWGMQLDGYGSCPRGHRRKMEER